MAVKSLRDLQHKENRRWEELAKNAPDQSDISDDVDLPISVKPSEQAQKIIELEHKLKQALENVRQADTVRQNLKEALSMNASLQTKLEEIKTKYAALQAGRGNNPNNPKAGTDAMSNVPPSATKEKSGSSEKLDPGKTEKMHREHRRMRKEMAALVASKDAAKTKLEVSLRALLQLELFVLFETHLFCPGTYLDHSGWRRSVIPSWTRIHAY